mmetsp:Transcript_31564/g.43943  ORF Transcript_31564/g.43943 Transcript_31564/m.43943 type:complete len:272 (+) Transcript_31564:67-882(+)|eukprot:CAMPEP_0185265954 /NCGR_PEP_ID=MMETSP1359-20130426/29385_1 /TAXON_ID=552665 /ORGANISM="Bigelowiella longifila, Strain CCMP242" /LENGTH=271 /DNA_ID=CAMNT_0027855513 /DNA_START=1 /DNA_END=816 /DNA_ORIENTATION=+
MSWVATVMALTAVLIAGAFFFVIYSDLILPKTHKRPSMSQAFPLEALMLIIEDVVPERTGNMTRYLTAIYIAAVQEYICAEILELSGRAAGYTDDMMGRKGQESSYGSPIMFQHVMKAIDRDQELAALFPSGQQVNQKTGNDGASQAQRKMQREMGEIAVSRVLQQVYPKARIDHSAKAYLNKLCFDLAKRILVHTVQSITEDAKGTGEFKTVTVQQSVRETLRGDLSKHAISEGTKYIRHFVSDGNSILQSNPESKNEFLRWPQDFLCVD